MRLALIYFTEASLAESNKFILDFSDREHVQPIEFLSNKTYYIATLNCKLRLQEYINEDDDIKKSSAKSDLLIDKGPDYLCDIDSLNLTTASYITSSSGVINFERTPQDIENYSYKYKFWDIKDKEIKDGKIYSPYSQLIAKGFSFLKKGMIGMPLITRLNQTDHCEKVNNRNFNLKQFVKKYYGNDKKGRFVIGNFSQRLALKNRKYMMPITFIFGNLHVVQNESFYTVENAAQMRNKTFLTQDGIEDMGSYKLTDEDLKELCNMLPNFQLTTLL